MKREERSQRRLKKDYAGSRKSASVTTGHISGTAHEACSTTNCSAYFSEYVSFIMFGFNRCSVIVVITKVKKKERKSKYVLHKCIK